MASSQDIANGAVSTAKMANNQFSQLLQSQNSANAALQQQIAALNKSIAGGFAGYNKQVYAPNIDLGAVYKAAGKSATAAVNPYYSKQINDYLAQQAFEQQRQQGQANLDIQNATDAYNQQVEANQLAQQRTGQDVATNIGQLGVQNQQALTDIATQRGRVGQDVATNLAAINTGEAQNVQDINTQRARTGADLSTNLDLINTQAQQAQQDSGQAFQAARAGLGKSVAQSGLGLSGIGKKAVAQNTAQQNTAEQRQAQTFAQQKQAEQLKAGRNYEDLNTAEQRVHQQASLDTAAQNLFQARSYEDLDTKQQRQVQQYNFNVTAQNLFPTRTFEDLAKSTQLADLTKQKGIGQIQFNLDTYLGENKVGTGKTAEEKIKNSGFKIKQTASDLEKQRQADIAQQTATYANQRLYKHISKIKNAAERDAALRAYGGAF